MTVNIQVNVIHLFQNKNQWWAAFFDTVMNAPVLKRLGNLLTSQGNCIFFVKIYRVLCS